MRSSSLGEVFGRLFVEPVLSAVFPMRCACCGEPIRRPTESPLCGGCWLGLPRHRDQLCRCGLPLPATLETCGRCRRGLSPVAAGSSLGPYQGSLRTAIHELKYGGRRRVANRLARELIESGSVAAVFASADALVPVPLHPSRLRDRGFNQAELLARELGRRAGLPVLTGALIRRRDTAPQAGLSAAGRRANVADAFVVRRKGPIAGRILVLVDDVTTTGATVLACATRLRECGAREVRLVSAARVS